MSRRDNVLRLNRETVRELDRVELEEARGGNPLLTNACIPYSEWVTCNAPTIRYCLQ